MQTTKDCLDLIKEIKWKRLSKTKTGNTVTRIFRCEEFPFQITIIEENNKLNFEKISLKLDDEANGAHELTGRFVYEIDDETDNDYLYRDNELTIYCGPEAKDERGEYYISDCDFCYESLEKLLDGYGVDIGSAENCHTISFKEGISRVERLKEIEKLLKSAGAVPLE